MPSSSEHSPLLPGSNGRHRRTSRGFFETLKGEGEATWAQSLKFLFSNWLSLLLVLIPLSAVAHYQNWDAGYRFGFSFFAIVPLAALLGEATEQVAIKLGETLGGLLNASFGNAVEIIVGVTALLQGEFRIVQTSLIGSILSNLLLVLGCSFFAGGLKYHESEFQETAAQTSASLMALACFTLVIPAAYNATQKSLPGGSQSGLVIISHGTSILLLFVYASYLFFQLNTHADLYKAKTKLKNRTGTQNNQAGGVQQEEEEEEEEEAHMSVVAAGASLLAITIVTAFVADYLVASIEETAEKYHLSKPFIGVILLPLVSNAAEHITSVWMAMKGKMELTIGISIGSSIQIATFAIPLLVVVGWITGRELTLFFENFETISLFVSVILVNLFTMDGKSNYMEGLMLITLYLVLALAFWVS